MSLIDKIEFLFTEESIDKTIFDKIMTHRCLNINSKIIDNFLFIANFTDKTFKLHLFSKLYNYKKKKYYTNRGNYICSFFINDKYLDNQYNIDKVINYDKDFTILDDLIKISNYPENIYSDLGVYNHIYNQSFRCLDEIEENDISINKNFINLDNKNLYNILDKMETGIYSNINDIRWQLYLTNIFTSSYSDGSLIQYFRSSRFESLKINSFYYPFSDMNNSFDNQYHNIYNFLCDCCNKPINKNEQSWHNNVAGDLCNNCYLNKKSYEKKNHIYIYNKIFLYCKKIIFNKELEKTKILLDRLIIPKLDINRKYEIQQNVIKEMSRHVFKKKYRCCPICLDVLDENLSSGKCGHIFHTKCVKDLVDSSCPLCKIETNFFKLFLYN